MNRHNSITAFAFLGLAAYGVLMSPSALAAPSKTYVEQAYDLKTLLKSQWDPADPVGVLDDPCAASQFHNQAEKLVRDFGELCHYNKDNEDLPKPTSERVVFVGDSITVNWGKDKILFHGDRINRGIGGQTTSQILVRFRADVIDLQPRVIHILAGTNDLAGNTGPTTLKRIQDNIASMIELAQAHNIQVIVGSIFPVRSYKWNPSVQPARSIAAMNLWLEDYCKLHHAVYVNYYKLLADPQGGMKLSYSEDGTHPNKLGYDMIRPLVLEALKKSGLN